MADGDAPVDIQSLISSVTQNPTDPNMMASLMSGAGPAVPPNLQQQAAATQAATSAPTPPPPGVGGDTFIPPTTPAPQGGSTLPPQLQQMMGGGGAPPPPQQENQFRLPTQPPQQQPGPPKMQIGGLPGLIMDILKPNRNAQPGQPTPTKLDNFEKFLTNFLGSLSAGFSQEGHGPGAAMRGAGAAMQAPYQQALQQYQMGLQQRSVESQEQLRNAQEEFNRQRSLEYSTVTVPMVGADGKIIRDAQGNMQTTQLPAKQAGPYMARIGSAEINKSTQEEKIAPQSKVAKEYMDIVNTKGADSPEARAKLQELTRLGVALKAGGASPFGKLTPEMAQIGMPPNYADVDKYPGGIKDPQFLKDVREYGAQVTALKQKNAIDLAKARGESYALSRAEFTQMPVLNQDTQTPEFHTPLEIAHSVRADGTSPFVPLVEGDKLMLKNAVFTDIQGANDKLRKAITANKDGFTASQVVLMTAAMSSIENGGTAREAIHNLIQAGGRSLMTKEQQAQAIATLQAYENGYALRGVAGFGAGSDSLRSAIRGTYPSAGSPRDYALQQMDAIDGQVSRLYQGVGRVKIRQGGEKPGGGNVNSGGGGGADNKGSPKTNKDGFPIAHPSGG